VLTGTKLSSAPTWISVLFSDLSTKLKGIAGPSLIKLNVVALALGLASGNSNFG